MHRSVCCLVAVATIVLISDTDARLYSRQRRQQYYCRLKRDMILAIKSPCRMTNLPLPPPVKARDCAALFKKGVSTNGVYKIKPFLSGHSAHKVVSVYCDMKTDGGGWTVFQRRFNGQVDFYRNWAAYKTGFGHAEGEYWLGNDIIHALTLRPSELRVDLEDWHGKTANAKYGIFAVGGASSKYKLLAGKYSGTAGNSLSVHNGKAFSTFDRDHSPNCAKDYHGAWWYAACHHSNLNGRYYHSVATTPVGVTWHEWKKSHESLMRAEMKVRPQDF